MPASPDRVLVALLSSLFEVPELGPFLSEIEGGAALRELLPGASASKLETMDQAALALIRLGLLDEGLVSALLRVRPGRRREILAFARDFQIPFQEAEGDGARAPSRGVPAGSSYDLLGHVELRVIEARARACLSRPGAPVVLWGPWLSGKTWLTEHLLRPLEQGEARGLTARVDPAFLLQNTSPDQDFWRLVAEEIARTLDMDTEGIDREWSRPNRGPMRLTRWMEDHALKLAGRRGGLLVLAFDPADGVIHSEVQDEFFGTLRAWSQRSGREWPRLRLLLSISTTPAHLVKGVHQSVFVLSDPLELGQWEPAECEALCELYGFPASTSRLLEEALGRHPYLLCTLLHRARSEGRDPLLLLDPARGAFDRFLREYHKRLLALPDELQAAARRLAEKGSLDLEFETAVRLCDIGLARRLPDGRCTLRASLFARLGG